MPEWAAAEFAKDIEPSATSADNAYCAVPETAYEDDRIWPGSGLPTSILASIALAWGTIFKRAVPLEQVNLCLVGLNADREYADTLNHLVFGVKPDAAD